jgi:hypothetical protein
MNKLTYNELLDVWHRHAAGHPSDQAMRALHDRGAADVVAAILSALPDLISKGNLEYWRRCDESRAAWQRGDSPDGIKPVGSLPSVVAEVVSAGIQELLDG